MKPAALACLLGLAVAATAVNGQTPEQPRVFLLVVDDLHLDFRNTPRLRKILQDLARQGHEEDTWALVTTGISSIRVAPAPGLAEIRTAISRLTGNALNVREQLDAFGNAERGAVVRRRASTIDIAIADTISHLAEDNQGRLAILFLTNGYDARMVPALSETVRATADARARLVAISVRDLLVPDPPFDVRPEEWAAYTEAARESLRTLAEQTGGQAVFSQPDFDTAIAGLLRP
jgi:hypothetical protein